MDEPTAVLKARRLTRTVKNEDVGLPIEEYIRRLDGVPENLVVKYDDSMSEDEAGSTVFLAGKHCILINANDSVPRQRFTACHEVAHIVLGLPCEHEQHEEPFTRRSKNEVICDAFAAELLLPSNLVRPLVEDSDFEFSAIEEISKTFGTSLSATGSRFALLCDRPCIFVLVQGGVVRYASRSRAMRDCYAWVRPGQAAPTRSMAAQLIGGAELEGPVEVEALEWLDDWKRGGYLLEQARHFPRFGQTLALLWFDDEVVEDADSFVYADDDEPALRELDGVLPWPGKSRRRR